MKSSGSRSRFGITGTLITFQVCAAADLTLAFDLAFASRIRPWAALAERAVRPQGIPVNPNSVSLSPIPDQFTGEGSPTPLIPFTLIVAPGSAANLQLAALSSNPTLIPNQNVIFGGNETNRTVVLFPEPRQIGTARITVTLTNGAIGLIPQTFSLTVTGRPPSVLVQPVSQMTPTGGDTQFGVAASGTLPLAYQWQFNGFNLSGATNSTLSLENILRIQTGEYRVVVSNVAGVTASRTARLTVIDPPRITAQSQSQIVAPGASVTLAATAGGLGPFAYQWRLNGEKIPGATNSVLTLTNIPVVKSGNYAVLIANPFGVVESLPMNVTVAADPLNLTDQFTNRIRLITPQGIGRGHNRGATKEPGEPNHADEPGGHSVWLSWSAPATGIMTLQTLGSTADTVLAVYTGNQMTNLTRVASDDDSDDFFASVVQFNAVASQDYEIAVDGFGGSEGDILLSWNFAPTNATIPVILSHPQNSVVAPGATVTFSVTATNPPPGISALGYQWLFRDRPIPGQTNSVLTLTNVGIDQVGEYDVLVSSEGGAVMSKDGHLQLNAAALGGPVEQTQAWDKFGNLVEFQSGVRLQGRKSNGQPNRSPFAAPARGYSGAQIFTTYKSTTEAGEPNHSSVIGGSSQWFSYQPATDGVSRSPPKAAISIQSWLCTPGQALISPACDWYRATTTAGATARRAWSASQPQPRPSIMSRSMGLEA